MASGQPFASRSYAGTKLPDRSANANAMPFSASSFSRHRGLGATAPEFGGAEGPKQSQQAPVVPTAAQSHGPAQDTNPLSRLTEEQREEINEAVRIENPPAPNLPLPHFYSTPSPLHRKVIIYALKEDAHGPRQNPHCAPHQSPFANNKHRTKARERKKDQANLTAHLFPQFTLFDLDRDRHLDYHELRVAFRALGFTLAKQELISLLTTYGVPRPQVQQQQGHANPPQAPKGNAGANPHHPSNLLMPLSSFQAVTALKILERDPRDEILRAFELFDEGGKGFIDLEDLRRVARELGETGLEEEELRAMIEEFDLEGAGGVTREALCGDLLAVKGERKRRRMCVTREDVRMDGCALAAWGFLRCWALVLFYSHWFLADWFLFGISTVFCLFL
ncbi:Calcium-binding EF-hand [Penicillium macrosclerotiorum]|uniref:Calcium-binding EF-hand n=1 Tax=Penicillium macrosclerotiorum TaxID=303699 RepID=UPI0025493D5B|nr:Calcium-binding EF-hand [Penicillium macrosclerotiorum]KAJ5679307.1 Calcium-binding EF-hand [Penicillium macrosclerotiorum]